MRHSESPLSGWATGRQLTDADLVTAIRFMVAAESEATRLYAQLAESTDNRLAVEVLGEMAGEQLVRVGALLRLLRELPLNDEQLVAPRQRRAQATSGMGASELA